jgi:hypothetical protein
MKHIMDTFLRHIDRDEDHIVNKVYPIIDGLPHDKVIVIVYGVASGQPDNPYWLGVASPCGWCMAAIRRVEAEPPLRATLTLQ